MLHRPKHVETTSALAILQEEELDNFRRCYMPKEFCKTGFKFTNCSEKLKAMDQEKSKPKGNKSETDE